MPRCARFCRRQRRFRAWLCQSRDTPTRVGRSDIWAATSRLRKRIWSAARTRCSELWILRASSGPGPLMAAGPPSAWSVTANDTHVTCNAALEEVTRQGNRASALLRQRSDRRRVRRGHRPARHGPRIGHQTLSPTRTSGRRPRTRRARRPPRWRRQFLPRICHARRPNRPLTCGNRADQ